MTECDVTTTSSVAVIDVTVAIAQLALYAMHVHTKMAFSRSGMCLMGRQLDGMSAHMG